ncbi:MAG TPA: adenylate/guanylate cyclase domain-containing protein [Gaiellaceae bacterium]|nr:adenylate/guanylate cyclase domain-containing protein [Gaiellaceae bacterium]
MRPETRYAKSGDVSIAYQVVGEGPFDLVYVPGAISNVDLIWDDPARAEFFARIASFCRLITFDKRGTGASDRVAGIANLETRMDDVRAVMDAAGSERAAIVGSSEGGPMSILFTATYPERIAALVVYGSLPRFVWAPDFPFGQPLDEYERDAEEWAREWGTVEGAAAFLRGQHPNVTEEEISRQASRQRLSASPGALIALQRMNAQIDVRRVLPTIQVPTLVLHRIDDQLPIEVARWTASQIPGARIVELPGGAHLPYFGDTDRLLGELEAFVCGVYEEGGWEAPEPDRVLATILFTDIVGSTAKAVELGDRGWRELVEQHHALVRQQLARYRGRELDTAGDGFFASFDGPARAIRCARAISDGVRELGIDVRAGLHTGECEVIEGKVGGIAVHIGARVAAQAEPGEVLVSSTVKDLVAGSGLEFADRGAAELKGVPGEWRLYALAAERNEAAAR